MNDSISLISFLADGIKRSALGDSSFNLTRFIFLNLKSALGEERIFENKDYKIVSGELDSLSLYLISRIPDTEERLYSKAFYWCQDDCALIEWGNWVYDVLKYPLQKQNTELTNEFE
jgi:hypothetical protein